MIKHIVAWRLKDSAHGNDKATNARQIKAKLEALRNIVPGLIKIEVGIDFSRTGDSSDIVLYSEFVDRTSLDEYQKHPEHEAVKAFLMEARSERRMADYEV